MPARRAQHEQDLEQLLEICEQFFGHAGPATRHQVDTLLQAHGIHGGPGWLIDMLAFARYRLQHPHLNDLDQGIPANGD
ncbi:hypothetical protein DMB66_21300 [Actinoplanes sp. ATCC 53533]|uniref:hypothetical protein n=1 Tax=Actinoplanes sp. ATCC 53533 TaxID=1288362 RepID=UPI000F789B85|nr:hypothetical protein [Actinoplanes sp. ATCC 53533]RSM64051.1 hypothetical protein DMB66_21300 [Actinoplanes sp. ATCC 53533]